MNNLVFDYSLSNIIQAAYKIARFAENCKIWTFEGDMGAGKTTLIKQICTNFEVKDKVSSPTFSLVNEYQTVENEAIYHFDFYRIKHEIEALDIGADEYFYSNSLCLIEWAEKIPSLLPKSRIEIAIKVVDENKRNIFVRKIA
ncbi:MAG: tRNA (adenosine(37)-N6)-threonylcarbamoyltransferase complex ATPase subunit type 1 TsaE [Cytophagales bacterium]